MNIIKLDKNNIDNEHICCAISDKKCTLGYELKKGWLKGQLDNGYVFKKYDVRHKVFIEYCPAEKAWAPIDAPGYMLINCFWVAGSFKGKGYGKKLLLECIKDSKEKNGIIIISSDKKRPYMSEKKFFLNQGFEICDRAEPYFELLVKQFKDAPLPCFKKVAKFSKDKAAKGFKLYYTNQCPFTELYAQEMLELPGRIKFHSS